MQVKLQPLEYVRKPSFVAPWREFRAKAVKPDEGVAQATPRRDERLVAETIAVGAEYGVFGHALGTPCFSGVDMLL